MTLRVEGRATASAIAVNSIRRNVLKSPETGTSELRCLCPFCGSFTQSGRIDAKFYINSESGLYHCFHCGMKGKDLPEGVLESLEIVDEIAKKPFNVSSLAKLSDSHEELTAFLKNRFALRAEDAKRPSVFKWSEEYQAIAIVIRNFHQDITGVKYRYTNELRASRYTSEPGSSHDGFWLKGSDDSKLLIVEGEIDAYTASLTGFEGSVLACQTNRIPESQLKAIRGYKNIFAIPDKDLGGEELKNSIQSLLGASEPIFIELPNDIKDLNELLQRRGYDECSQFIRLQTRTALERDTKSFSESIPELLAHLSDERNTIGSPTGWGQVDHLLGGGLRVNEMSVINAFAKTGKTSFVNNLIHNLAKSGKQVALASFEMDPARSIYPTLLSIASKLNIRELEPEERELVALDYPNSYPYLDNIITLRRFGYTAWNEVEEWAVLMKKTRNIDFLVLDHAGFMVEKMTDAEENQILAKSIKKLTNTLAISILVIVQAPKTKDGLSIQTAYGGLAWAMNADNFIILERSKDNETELRVKLEAARYPGANPSSTPALLFYQRESCSLTE